MRAALALGGILASVLLALAAAGIGYKVAHKGSGKTEQATVRVPLETGLDSANQGLIAPIAADLQSYLQSADAADAATKAAGTATTLAVSIPDNASDAVVTCRAATATQATAGVEAAAAAGLRYLADRQLTQATVAADSAQKAVATASAALDAYGKQVGIVGDLQQRFSADTSNILSLQASQAAGGNVGAALDRVSGERDRIATLLPGYGVRDQALSTASTQAGQAATQLAAAQTYVTNAASGALLGPVRTDAVTDRTPLIAAGAAGGAVLLVLLLWLSTLLRRDDLQGRDTDRERSRASSRRDRRVGFAPEPSLQPEPGHQPAPAEIPETDRWVPAPLASAERDG